MKNALDFLERAIIFATKQNGISNNKLEPPVIIFHSKFTFLHRRKSDFLKRGLVDKGLMEMAISVPVHSQYDWAPSYCKAERDFSKAYIYHINSYFCLL